MRKILLLIITFTLAFNSYAQFPEKFTDATFPPAGWVTFDNGIGTVQNWQKYVSASGTTYNFASIQYENVTDGTFAEDWLVTPQFTVDATNHILTFSATDLISANYGSNYYVKISTNSQNTSSDFVDVLTMTETTFTPAGTFATYNVDLSNAGGVNYIGQQVYIAFVMSNDDGDFFALDDVDMAPVATAAPDMAINPTPANSATNVVIDTTDNNNDGNPDMTVVVSWDEANTGEAATSYDLYIGTDATSLSFGGSFSVAPYSISWSGRAYDTTYFWKAVAKNYQGEAIGSSTWSFTTQAEPAASLEEETLSSALSVYPTATTDNFTIKNTSNIALTSVSLFDINGRVVLTQNLENLIGEKVINISNLSTGIYFVELNSADAKITKKIIKK